MHGQPIIKIKKKHVINGIKYIFCILGTFFVSECQVWYAAAVSHIVIALSLQ